ncbi:MAG: mRNA-binding ribosome synthesis protein nop7 [Thelocarpon impressellum]|nr:MAG: mRNA-binding ribosome synthesis protein nop7 [Thelocarpon impressellum]
MGKVKKKGTAGQAKNFITRTQAVRKLQISLPDFRRLCIFKGIYPREPRNKKKASKSSTSSTTFYYTKDIQYLLHEPLLKKFREHKTLSKKISKALGRGEISDAARLERNHTPRLSLDHVIKERYPTFVDALRDLDDALSMLFLFANLPSTTTVPPKTIALCQRLCLEFQHYLITTHSVRKSFLSIKGIYYQATIQGQDILWLVPYKFVQRVTGDVDFRIMGTFVEFYTTLLGFVNFRLYTSIGLVYPPKFSSDSDDRGGELRAFTLEGRSVAVGPMIQVEVNGTKAAGRVGEANGNSLENNDADLHSIVRKIAAIEHDPDDSVQEEQEPDDQGVDTSLDTFDAPISADADVLDQPSASSEAVATLFSPLTFFLSRETPRQPLEFLLRAFGSKRIAWDSVLGDGSFTDENDASITHQVVDRPAVPMDGAENGEDGDDLAQTIKARRRVPGRTYIQPQWVWDCVNEGRLLRPDLYAPGAELPAHLSPWVKPTKGQYDPTAPLAEQEREGEAEAAEEDAEGDDASDGEFAEEANGLDEHKAEREVVDDGMDVAGSSSEVDEDEAGKEEEWDGFDEDPAAESDDEAITHQRELEAEAAGVPLSALSAPAKQSKKKAAAKKRREEEEELARQKMMMSRKKRKTLDKMLYSNRKKDDEAEALRAKRRKIEKKAKLPV